MKNNDKLNTPKINYKRLFNKWAKKDTISTLRKNEEKNKKEEQIQNIEDYSDKSEDEEETKSRNNKRIICSNKRSSKELKDLFDSEPQIKEKKKN